MFKYLIKLFRKKRVQKKEPEESCFGDLPRVPLKEVLDIPACMEANECHEVE